VEVIMRILNGIFLGSIVLGGCAGVSTEPDPSTQPSEVAVSQGANLLTVGERPRPRVPARIRDSLRAGAVRLAELQADQIGDSAHNGLTDPDPDDGGWDFTLPLDQASHGAAISPENLYGATALGVYAAIKAGVDGPRFLTVLLSAGLGAQGRPEVDSPSDFVFLPLLGEMVEDPAWSELARQRFDARLAAAGGAQVVGERARDARHAANLDGLIAYDNALWHLAAASLDAAYPGSGYDTDAATFAQIVVSDLTSAAPLFEIGNPNENYYVQGLAWSFLLLDRSSGFRNLRNDVRDRLLALQNASGAWGWNGPNPEDNAQATAHVVQALALSSANGNRVRRAAGRGADWLVSVQQPNGGWEYSPGLESALLDGEALLAIYLQSRAGRSDDLAPDDSVGTSAASLKRAAAVQAAPALSAPSE
jgi:hypothetical protein